MAILPGNVFRIEGLPSFPPKLPRLFGFGWEQPAPAAPPPPPPTTAQQAQALRAQALDGMTRFRVEQVVQQPVAPGFEKQIRLESADGIRRPGFGNGGVPVVQRRAPGATPPQMNIDSDAEVVAAQQRAAVDQAAWIEGRLAQAGAAVAARARQRLAPPAAK